MKIFNPAIKFMGKLKFATKFGLIAAVFVIPILNLGYFFFSEINSTISFVKNERSGVVYLQPVYRALASASELQQAQTLKSLGKSAETEASISSIDKAFGDITAVNAKYGTEFKCDADFQKLKSSWESLKSKTFKDSADVRDSFGAFTDQLLGFSAVVATNSQLVLDPDVDSYYTMDSALIQLPAIFQKTAQTRDRALTASADGLITPEEKTDIIVLQTQYHAAAGVMKGDFDQSTGATAQLKGSYEPVYTKFTGAMESFDKTLGKGLLDSGAKGLGTDETLKAASTQFEAARAQYATYIRSLDTLLATREAKFVARKSLVQNVVGIFLLLASYLFAGFYMSTIKNLKKMVNSAAELSAGKTDSDINLEGKDELSVQGQAMLEQVQSRFQAITYVAQEVAQGNLVVDFETCGPEDTLGNSIKSMVQDLRKLVATLAENSVLVAETSESLSASVQQSKNSTDLIGDTVQQVAQASTESSRASHEMAQGCESMAMAATQAAASMQELQHAIETVKDGVEQELNSVTEASEIAYQSDQTVRETLEIMSRIKEEVETSAKHVRELGAKGEEIGAIVETIREIAEQTNLLALNAAIEAARAGEHGRGFSVVADEVRKLAERSAQATTQIGSLIEQVRTNVSSTLKAMDQSTTEVNKGAEQSQVAAEALVRMLNHTEKVREQMQLLGETATEMSNGTRSLSNAIETSASVSEETAAGAEEVSANAQEVSEATERVAREIERQVVVVGELSDNAESLRMMSQNLQEIAAGFRYKEEEEHSASPWSKAA